MKSSGNNGDSIKIQLQEENSIFLAAMYARVLSGGKSYEGFSDQEGLIKFPKMPVDSLSLVFEFAF